MADSASLTMYKESLIELLDETFEHVQGRYLDRGTSLFETLAMITAAEASQPVSPTCATLAAQVEHVRFYMDVNIRALRGETIGKLDWKAIWETVSTVTNEEWEASKTALRTSYQTMLDLLNRPETWESEDAIGESFNLVVHTAYHLGEMRQALCTLKQSR